MKSAEYYNGVWYVSNGFLFCGNLHQRLARSYHIAHPDQNSLDESVHPRLDGLLHLHRFKYTDAFGNVQQVQFYQRERGRVELRIKPKPSYTERDTRQILQAMNEKMGDTMEISLSFHEEIPLSPRGKFRLVIQELDIPPVPTDETQAQTHS